MLCPQTTSHFDTKASKSVLECMQNGTVFPDGSEICYFLGLRIDLRVNEDYHLFVIIISPAVCSVHTLCIIESYVVRNEGFDQHDSSCQRSLSLCLSFLGTVVAGRFWRTSLDSASCLSSLAFLSAVVGRCRRGMRYCGLSMACSTKRLSGTEARKASKT